MIAIAGARKTMRLRAGAADIPWRCLQRLGITMAIAGAVTLLAPIKASQADYAGPIHSEDEIKRFVEYHGPVSTKELVAVWKRDFLGESLNRAFAVSSGGSFGAAWHARNPDSAIDAAMKSCRERGEREHLGADCQVYAVNTKIIYPGLEFELPKLDIKFGNITSRNGYVFHGPHSAKGVIVWSQGMGKKCQDSSSGAVWPFVNWFNLAGWDVLELVRGPCYDKDFFYAQHLLTNSIPKLHEMGYPSIVLVGQSGGGYLSVDGLRIDKIRDLITGVISVAGAWDTGVSLVSDKGGGDAAVLKVPDDWHQLISGIEPTPARVVLLFFDGDPYDPLSDQVARHARERLTRKQIANLVIYEDDPEILNQASQRNGHFSAGGRKFTLEYSDCLIHFIEAGEKTGMCAKY